MESGAAAMGYSSIIFEVKEGVGLICFNRPDEGNALTVEMARELQEIATLCDEEPEVRAVVLTGRGKMFCAGGDLKAFASHESKVSLYLKEATQAINAAISRFCWMDAPVVAAVNGTAAGGGFSLALSADFCVAAESARFTMGYTKIGAAPDASSSFFLARMVGMRRAKEMALLNPILSARQAMEWGIVNRVVADDQVLDSAFEIARQWAEGPTRSIGETKRLILSGATESLESQLERESRAISTMAGSAEGKEGVAAFLEKRSPVFRR
jgi:2-(1,2-epoxy-1,2-dihydrophenyl)acetyl-CoA isomerase